MYSKEYRPTKDDPLDPITQQCNLSTSQSYTVGYCNEHTHIYVYLVLQCIKAFKYKLKQSFQVFR